MAALYSNDMETIYVGTIEPGDGRLFFKSDTFDIERRPRRAPVSGFVEEAARSVPLHATCDVLVVGGGPAGVAAAVSAARTGADVILLERYNHLGGLSTGGLVIWIDRMTDWSGNHVIRGFAEEILGQLPAAAIAGPPREAWGSKDVETAHWWSLRSSAFHGTVTYAPTIDPEWLKLRMMETVLEAGVHPIFHAWGAQPIVEDGVVAGCLFESKQGRRAIRAKVTIDASGDGDIYAGAGAAFSADVNREDIHACVNTAWLFGDVNMDQFLRFRDEEPEQYEEFLKLGRERLRFFEKPAVSWRPEVAVFMGPRLSGFSPIDVEDLSEVEIISHRLMLEHLKFYRENAPGFSDAFMMLSAPQIGIRHARRLEGTEKLLRQHWDGRVRDDEIGVSPALSPKFPNVSVPYGALVPAVLDGLLAPGRHLSTDANSHSFMREIPQCWLTGQAAGVAASVAVSRGVQPRAAPVREVQSLLGQQGVYLQRRST